MTLFGVLLALLPLLAFHRVADAHRSSQLRSWNLHLPAAAALGLCLALHSGLFSSAWLWVLHTAALFFYLAPPMVPKGTP